MSGEVLRNYRIQRGITQLWLARKAKVSRYKIQMYEYGNGDLNKDEKQRIRKAFKCYRQENQTLKSRRES